MKSVERLNNRQVKYEERMQPYTEMGARRDSLFERARSLSGMYKEIGQDGIVLHRSPGGQATLASIYKSVHGDVREEIESDAPGGYAAVILISNATDESHVELKWAYEIRDSANRTAKKGRALTPIGLAINALSIRAIEKNLDKFENTLGMVEEAAANPELNFDLSEHYEYLVSIQGLTPQDFDK